MVIKTFGQGSSTTLVEDIKEAFEKRFYATNNSTRINLHDNFLILLTTAVNLRYRLDFFPANLKQKAVRLLISELKIIAVVRLVKFL